MDQKTSKKIERLKTFKADKELAIFDEIANISDTLAVLAENSKELPVEPGIKPPRVQRVKLEGVSVVSIKGDRGEKGDTGEAGARGATGAQGPQGVMGSQGVMGPQGAPGVQGAVGPQGDKGEQGTAGSPDMAEDIRNKLELFLEEDDKLKIGAIGHLLERLDAIDKRFEGNGGVGIGPGGGHGALYSLIDVELSGLLTGQSIKWDGIRWIPYTPASGSNTPVYNEVVAGATNTFTLAHTPAAGTVRVYANGQRINVTTDYTLSGAVITTVGPWTAGMITADYEY